jgi:sec-independent protein translocase protein TatC
MSEQQEEMSFWDHLEALRWTLFRCIIALIVFAVGAFAYHQFLADEVIMAPSRPDFILYKALCKLTSTFSLLSPILPDFCNTDFNFEIINTKIGAPFFVTMTTSFWLALLLTFPYLMYEVWKFVSPALYSNEKKNVRWVFLFGTFMFFLGCAVGYFLVFPMTFRFLITWTFSEFVRETVDLSSYIDTFIMLIFIMGVMFELPLLSWLLSKLGLVTRAFFNKYRRHAIVGLLVLAAFITPSSDPFTLGAVFFPLYGLYELSAFFVKKAPKEISESTEVATT